MADYRKWDHLELSDDSDIEVHPNVDKRSFIIAKQHQIHAEREQRKRQIEALKYEHILNGVLEKRLDSLISSTTAVLKESPASRNPTEVAFEMAMKLVPSNDRAQDLPPTPPEGFLADTYTKSYTAMLLGIVDHVKQGLDEKATDQESRHKAFLQELDVHLQDIRSLQHDILAKLETLQTDTGKITSESYHTGFDSSHVTKSTVAASEKPQTVPELLDPNYDMPAAANRSSTAVLADSEDGGRVSPAAKAFAKIQSSDYQAIHAYISSNPEILQETEVDALLVEAFELLVENEKSQEATQYVHQAVLLQYCRMLGRDRVSLFFGRMATPGHQTRDFFYKEVAEKLQRIRELAKKQRQVENEGGVQQIQIHAVEPGTEIQIVVPEPGSDERATFEQFSPEMRAALEAGSLDQVNQVLGAMDVAEAEELIRLLGEANCLSIEEVIDATTEKGREHSKNIQQSAHVDEKGQNNDAESSVGI